MITPTRGLLRPEALVSADLLREFAAVDVSADDQRYRRPLDRSLRTLTRALAPDARVVLLGSIATGKYLDVLTKALGTRLHFPADFVGRGDMSRGGLMLRSAASGVELDVCRVRGGGDAGTAAVRPNCRRSAPAGVQRTRARDARSTDHLGCAAAGFCDRLGTPFACRPESEDSHARMRSLRQRL